MAEQLRQHLPGPEILTPEEREGDPDAYSFPVARVPGLPIDPSSPLARVPVPPSLLSALPSAASSFEYVCRSS